MKYFRRNKTTHTEKKESAARIPTRNQMPHVSSLPIITGVGEDEASHDRHVKILALECKKSKPNKHALGELMNRTFPIRRQRIMSSQESMESLLKTYPPLQQYNQVFLVTYRHRQRHKIDSIT